MFETEATVAKQDGSGGLEMIDVIKLLESNFS